ncbi:hypothetical protein BDZ94DRAFT_782977 [Collybia nuda]|uniref:Uncharacterized protein n=1 Tax=Collybia nuda TaxID=64659 RepID=A0A9P5YGV0_9AGAR|nr:hypothetical protein BDZ94DRAFT_782977 [Collybia nuda]
MRDMRPPIPLNLMVGDTNGLTEGVDESMCFVPVPVGSCRAPSYWVTMPGLFEMFVISVTKTFSGSVLIPNHVHNIMKTTSLICPITQFSWSTGTHSYSTYKKQHTGYWQLLEHREPDFKASPSTYRISNCNFQITHVLVAGLSESTFFSLR